MLFFHCGKEVLLTTPARVTKLFTRQVLSLGLICLYSLQTIKVYVDEADDVQVSVDNMKVCRPVGFFFSFVVAYSG